MCFFGLTHNNTSILYHLHRLKTFIFTAQVFCQGPMLFYMMKYDSEQISYYSVKEETLLYNMGGGGSDISCVTGFFLTCRVRLQHYGIIITTRRKQYLTSLSFGGITMNLIKY